jgi:hypothetical protein
MEPAGLGGHQAPCSHGTPECILDIMYNCVNPSEHRHSIYQTFEIYIPGIVMGHVFRYPRLQRRVRSRFEPGPKVLFKNILIT